MVTINQPAPEFKADIFQNEKIKKLSLSELRGKWVVLFFYPADFTFVCPTEIGSLADNYDKLKEMNVEVLTVSTDTVFTHKAWHDSSETIKKVKFPMVADPTGKICKAYGTYIEDEEDEDAGLALRGTFFIDPDGILRSMEINANNIGRSVDEILRKLEAAQYVREHGEEVCPMNWKKGSETLKPGLELVGKI